MKNDAHIQELYTIFLFHPYVKKQIERMKIDAESVVNVPYQIGFCVYFEHDNHERSIFQ
jgi:hypothetical protein